MSRDDPRSEYEANEALAKADKPKFIEGMGYDGHMWHLRDSITGARVEANLHRHNFRGMLVHVTGGRPPLKESSEGHVYVGPNAMYYASVVNAEWVRESGSDPRKAAS